MPTLNDVKLIGRLGATPEQKNSPGGGSLCTAPLAVPEKWKENGEWQEKTHWIDLVAFGYAADDLMDLAKGAEVLAEGSITTSKWQDDDGTTRKSYSVKVRRVSVLSRAGETQGEPPKEDSGDGGDFNQSFDDDDIPF